MSLDFLIVLISMFGVTLHFGGRRFLFRILAISKTVSESSEWMCMTTVFLSSMCYPWAVQAP